MYVALTTVGAEIVRAEALEESTYRFPRMLLVTVAGMSGVKAAPPSTQCELALPVFTASVPKPTGAIVTWYWVL
jgi:hypothetical protein